MDKPARNAWSRPKIDALTELAGLAQAAEVMGLSVPQVRGLIRDLRPAHVPVDCRLIVPKTLSRLHRGKHGASRPVRLLVRLLAPTRKRAAAHLRATWRRSSLRTTAAAFQRSE